MGDIYPPHSYSGTPGIIGGNCQICHCSIIAPWHVAPVRCLKEDVGLYCDCSDIRECGSCYPELKELHEEQDPSSN